MTAELNSAIEEKLKQLDLAHESLKVFGVIRCNVHVRCVGFETASKWASALSEVFKGTKVSCVKTAWEAVENKETCLRPTMRNGYLITVAA